jgi:beta-ribofuranosylaminobenzene 5'-phosphate synthase
VHRRPNDNKDFSMADPTEPMALSVTAPARLHLGFLDLNGALGRTYGSIGLAINQPATRCSVRQAARDAARGPESERALNVISRLREVLALPGAYDITVESAIPAHAGLGSGTQLALAVATAALRLAGIARPLDLIGVLTRRGQRSAIGIAAFDHGGFIVDGGKGHSKAPPPVLIQTPLPEHWRIVLILDPAATGVHGDRETRAFEALPPMSRETAAHLSHLVLMQAVPALMEDDIATFGRAITEIQALVGAHFSSAQGGSAWSNPKVGEIARKLGGAGAVGIGQSSWGPTGFAFAASQKDADTLYHSFVEDAKAQGLDLMIVAGRNRGAKIEIRTTADTGQ